MKDIEFGLSRKPDPDNSGIQTSVAINKEQVVEVHRSEGASTKLWYRIGRPNQMHVRWNKSQKLDNDNGTQPSICMNNEGLLVEVHKAQTWNNLWYHIGQTNGDQIEWGSSVKYDSGMLPSIAIDNDNWCIEVHSSEGAATGLWYRLGRVNSGNKKIEWVFSGAKQYDKGYRPRVAMNNNGVVVEVHNNEVTHNTLWYTVGILDKQNNIIHWGDHREYGNGGSMPSVAITDDGFVIETHRSESLGTLWRHVGRVDTDNKKIEWSGSKYFDDGTAPSVACKPDGSLAIQTHKSENSDTIWYSTSLITDRSNWMHDNLNTLGNKNLKQLILPAAHDAAMYPGKLPDALGKTQDLNIYEQLSYGIRYFDLRPGWNGSQLYIYHGDIRGPELSKVLEDIHSFMKEGHQELVILKFSHYKKFDEKIYKKLINRICDSLGDWLFTSSSGQRLSNIPLNNFINGTGSVLVVCDKEYPEKINTKGIWPYRDWETKDPQPNDLRVYDQYTNTPSYDKMKSDQIKKNNEYNKKLKTKPNQPCDLFLLSWTLTFWPVWPYARTANRNLAMELATLSIPNNHGAIPNLIYVDYVQYARVTDCVIALNRKVRSRLKNDEYLAVGQRLISPNGVYSLILQKDGNLVLYKDGQSQWSSGTYGKKVIKAVQQTDGNFVLYKEGGKPVWSSQTSGNRHAHLTLQDDGNLVIYSADNQWLWDIINT